MFKYDAQNGLTNMLDAVGTTVYGYDAAGQFLAEDGPWADNTVSYTYNNRSRESMSVQSPTASSWAVKYGYDAARLAYLETERPRERSTLQHGNGSHLQSFWTTYILSR